MSRSTVDIHLEELCRDIAEAMEEEILPLLPPIGKWRLTFIARIDGNPDADVLVSPDTEEGLKDTVERSFARPAVVYEGTVVYKGTRD